MQPPMFVTGSPCLLTVQQRVSETILLKICQCFECLALRCSPISESRLDAFSQRSGSKVQLQWQFWMRNGSQVILPPLCCQILADCPRATSAKLRNWCRVQPCRGFIWFSSGGTLSSSKDQIILVWLKYSPNAQLVPNNKRCPVIKKIYNPNKGTLVVECANERSSQDALQITKRPWLIIKSPNYT